MGRANWFCPRNGQEQLGPRGSGPSVALGAGLVQSRRDRPARMRTMNQMLGPRFNSGYAASSRVQNPFRLRTSCLGATGASSLSVRTTSPRFGLGRLLGWGRPGLTGALLDVATNEPSDDLRGRGVLLGAQALEICLLTGIDQDRESGGAVFEAQVGSGMRAIAGLHPIIIQCVPRSHSM